MYSVYVYESSKLASVTRFVYLKLAFVKPLTKTDYQLVVCSDMPALPTSTCVSHPFFFFFANRKKTNNNKNFPFSFGANNMCGMPTTTTRCKHFDKTSNDVRTFNLNAWHRLQTSFILQLAHFSRMTAILLQHTLEMQFPFRAAAAYGCC